MKVYRIKQNGRAFNKSDISLQCRPASLDKEEYLY